MSFDWLQYLDLASELYEQAGSSGHRDANLRSSISRAYKALSLRPLSEMLASHARRTGASRCPYE